MKIIHNTPDLLIARYRPVSLAVFGFALTALFATVAVFALINADWRAAALLFCIVGLFLFACHKQQLQVGVYCDRTHDTVAIQTRRILSKQTAIYPLTQVTGATLQNSGLEQRIALLLTDGHATKPQALTCDFHPSWQVRKAAETMDTWFRAAR
jgi:uncharacterized membrane protein YdbT with pleckstrin-like domain